VADLAAKVHALTGLPEADYTPRQAAYDLRKLRAHNLVIKPGRSRRYQVPPDATRTITAITTLRDRILAPLLGDIRSPRSVHHAHSWTDLEHDYQNLRLDMETLFQHLGIATPSDRKLSLAA
jgi:hypothetical protein